MAIIQAEKLVKAYGLLPVLRGLTLSIERGEFVALLGHNGSGKSTFLRLLTGLTAPTSGHLTIGGWQIPQEMAAVRAQIGLVAHRSLLYENLTARENLMFFGRLYGLSGRELDSRISDLLGRVGLGKRAHDQVRTFSRGMSQRLSIARALLHDPAVLLFDEPYTGLDQTAMNALDRLLLEAHQGGRTIIMTTHQIDKAVQIAHRAMIIARGVIAYDGQTDRLDVSGLAAEYARVNS